MRRQLYSPPLHGGGCGGGGGGGVSPGWRLLAVGFLLGTTFTALLAWSAWSLILPGWAARHAEHHDLRGYWQGGQNKHSTDVESSCFSLLLLLLRRAYV